MTSRLPKTGLTPHLLGRVALFQGLSEESLLSAAQHFSTQRLADGEVLFHAGDEGARFYVVIEGTLEVSRHSDSQDKEVVIGKLSPGEAMGELAILLGQRRSATVRARGRALVGWISAENLLAMARTFPEISMGIARYLGDRLSSAQNSLYQSSDPELWGIALSGCVDHALVYELARYTAEHVQKLASARARETGEAAARVALLWVGASEQAAQSKQDAAPSAASPRESEALIVQRMTPAELRKGFESTVAQLQKRARIVMVAGDPEWVAARQGLCEHILIDEQVQALFPAWDHRYIELAQSARPSRQRVVMAGQTRALVAGRVARLFLGCSIGLALGGGAALGMAHLGVLEVLEREGIPIDFISGTSMGALIGALYAANGLEKSKALALGMSSVFDWLRLIDLSFWVSGILQGNRITRFLRSQLEKQTFEALTIPVSVVGFDLSSGDEVVIGSGPIEHGVRASIAIPGLFTPLSDHGGAEGARRLLVDGGVINNVPIDVVRHMGADRVIGVHVMGGEQPEERGRFREIEILGRKFMRLSLSSRIDILLRAHFLLMAGAGNRQVITANVPIVIDTARFKFMEFWRAGALIEEGTKAAMAHVERLRSLRF